jgi:hypothetical protein
MAIDFPSSPNVNDTFTSGSIVYTYDGTKWTAEPAGVSGGTKIEVSNTKAEIIDTGSDGRFVITTEGTERARIDSSGRLSLGSSTATLGGNAFRMAILGTKTYSELIPRDGLAVADNTATAQGVGGSITLHGIYDGVGNYTAFAGIEGQKENGTTGNYAGALVFKSRTHAGSLNERMRITSAGVLLYGKTTDSLAIQGIQLFPNGTQYNTRSGGVLGILNRTSNDGTLLAFHQDGTEEGTITVSGTTVGYNGAHLSRWSQLPAGTERTEILRGTVLSNIDEMCAWGDEDNEQLNRMKVSDVEGDPNVSGVFQSWDDDDDTYTDDFYCAMTGDFIIRIADGVTVQRGDLLMSAGDGTAKPQEDDIVRSKTVAKVTSTHVTCTYEDGSYCVPCVLMAC